MKSYSEENNMQYKDEIRKNMQIIAEIKEKYGLDSSDIKRHLEEMEEFRVTSPVIGNFSTGKSSLINAILEKSLLSVDITPETAVPTEIYYGKNRAYQHFGGKIKEYGMEELPLKDLNVRNTDFVRIEYECDFLREIPTVKIVDLPGFDTSIELHNKAIDQYLPNSLAYLLVVSSDEPVLKESIADLLKELKIHKIPVYLIITKCKRLSQDDLMACKNLLQSLVKGILEVDEVKCACVESVGNIQVEEVKEFLREIQQKTAEIFDYKYLQILRKSAKFVEVYILDRIDKKDLSTSELEQEKEKLEKEIQDAMNRIDKEMQGFDSQTDECIEAVKDRIRKDLEEALDVIAVLVRNGNDISERVNGIVRNAVAISVKAEFEPRLHKYMQNISDVIQVDTPYSEEMRIQFNKMFGDNIIKSIFTTAAPIVMAAIGVAIAGPILAVIGGILGAFADVAFNITNERKKERQAKKAAKQIIEKVAETAAETVELGIREYVVNVNTEIKSKILKHQRVLEKSLEDIKTMLDLEEYEKSQEIAKLENDLQAIRKLMTIEEM
ncbi:dynamin family protein [Anaeromicropila populeti]|uniref:Dynamin family protein n=1 Tax=Anaeromicropila populeti TaxID=37658 RepID=A0A1I6HLR4_9FIRM|nr:dynamin family protein [Anaeromicropila populeti]SFR55344.1 Dynamin family protein [Anaeromicropila populeti]